MADLQKIFCVTRRLLDTTTSIEEKKREKSQCLHDVIGNFGLSVLVFTLTQNNSLIHSDIHTCNNSIHMASHSYDKLS